MGLLAYMWKEKLEGKLKRRGTSLGGKFTHTTWEKEKEEREDGVSLSSIIGGLTLDIRK